MGVAEPVHKRLTEAEYLDLERSLEARNEFFDGEVFAMSGGTPLHSQIATNLARELGNKLKGRDCIPYNSDLRLKVEATGLFTYPDLSVVCGPLQFAPGTDDTVVNPRLIIEVLSDSTEAYDRGKKFENYRHMPSLREYLLVSQKEPRIEQFVRQPNGQWLLRDAAGLDATMALPSLEIDLFLAEVFAGVEFVPAPIRAQTPPRH
jgi:Uma2 family endonuclease